MSSRQDYPIGDTVNGQYVQFAEAQIIKGYAQGKSNKDITGAYAASLLVKTDSGIVYGISGYNSAAASQFIQLHDAFSLGNAADGSIPITFFVVAAASNFSIDFGISGRSFSAGLLVCNSSTATTKTIGSADCWFDVRYV